MEWKGDWSDESKLWTEEAKAQVDFRKTDDGTFWISLADYHAFFAVTTVCFSSSPDHFKDTIMSDLHQFDSFGVIKMTVPQDVKTHFVVTLDQINGRFVDPENMGGYQYLYCRLMVSKVIGQGENKSAFFLQGDEGGKNNYCVVFKEGIAKGEYLITFRAEYDGTHAERKLVIGAYNHEANIELNRLDPDNFTYDRFNILIENLANCLSERDRYVVPNTFSLH